MAEAASKTGAKRLPHLDILRLIAILFVIFNHTGPGGYTLFAADMDSPISYLYMIASIVCKSAVPLFFMISGALLLKKDEPLKQIFTKRILRILAVLFIISIPYYYWLKRSNGLGITDFLSYIYGNSASTSLWYLYSYIGMLLMLPFLRSMVKSLRHNDYVYLIVGHIVLVGVLPCVQYCLSRGNATIHESFTPVIFVTQCVFYALIGYFLEHILDKTVFNKKTVVAVVILNIAAIAVTCLMTWYHATVKGTDDLHQMEQFFNCFISIPTMSIFSLVKYLTDTSGNKCSQGGVLSLLGGAVFGVYLIEKFVRALTGFVRDLLSPYLGSFISSIIWCVIVCFISFLIVIPLKHIPVIKRIVNKFI